MLFTKIRSNNDTLKGEGEERKKDDDVPESCHGDDGVPESGRNGGEIGSVDVLLCVEHDSGEDDDGHGQREDEEAQLGGATLERVAQDAEALRMPRKFENAEDAEDSQRHKRSCLSIAEAIREKFDIRLDLIGRGELENVQNK